MAVSQCALRNKCRISIIVAAIMLILPNSTLLSAKLPQMTIALSPTAGASDVQFNNYQRVATIKTRYAPIVYYVPAHPRHVLVLAFGYPWDEASDATILSYAQANVRDWTAFAEREHVLVVAPVLGGSNFVDYRELSGRIIDPDSFVDAVIDGPTQHLMNRWNGKFCLHGHSAGAQFTARYVVAHPDRLECAILSAPSTYAMPTRAITWPFGMAASHTRGQHRAPSEASWQAAATSTRISVIVGSLDTETRPPAPGQIGASRFARAHAWVAGMHALAARHGGSSQVTFTEVRGSAHDERRMALAAMQILERFYHDSPGS